MKAIPWSQLTVGDLQEFQKEFLEKGTVRVVDGDQKAVLLQTQ